MVKEKSPSLPRWVQNLRTLMDEQNFNARSLSLRAGLNATAVRDMLEGRSRFPRYDTVQALATALNTTPALLMSDSSTSGEIIKQGEVYGQNLDLLTEIIARVQETAEEMGRKVKPEDFAAMVSTIYHRLQKEGVLKTRTSAIKPQIYDLFSYETLRKKQKYR